MDTKKVVTKEHLQRRILNAPIHVDKTKDTKEVYFNDKLLRLTVDESEGYAIVGTLNHKHLFSRITPNGVSKPYLYISHFVDMALENDCTIKDDKGNLTRSYAKLMNVLDSKEDKTDFKIATYVDWYLFNIFTPLYSISEDAVGNLRVYLQYLHNIAISSVLLGEHKEGLTSKQFVEEYKKTFNDFVDNISDYQIFAPLDSDEVKKQNDKAEQEFKNEQIVESVKDE